MLPTLRLLACLLVALVASAAHAQEVSFTHDSVQADARRYESHLKATSPPGTRQGRDLRTEGDRLLAVGKDYRAASRAFAQATVFDANDADAWLGLARALLAITSDHSGERYDLPVNASGAAWNAYQRGKTTTTKAAALFVLHEAFRRRSYWRAAIDALRASVALAPDAQAQTALEALVAEHGFRITEYKVDSDAAQPRLCIQFSEQLASGQADWAQYVQVNGKDPQAATAEARQICIDGLAHGGRYEVRVRAGLPSAIRGEALSKTAEMAVYVRDRAPSVRAVARSYVLPNRGQQGIPLVTVNADKVQLAVYRIGDRSIAQVLQSGEFQRQLSPEEVSTLKERTGAQVYSGEMQITSRLNEDVTTAFPVAEAVPQLQPGVYVLAAHVAEKAGGGDGGDNAAGRRATQWFIVSDLGLTAINGDDGVHAFVRSLATTAPVATTGIRLIARNNEVLATAKTDARGHVRFDPALLRGAGGQAPAVLVAETDAGDYAFLDMAAAAFDLTDRGVSGRAEPGPVDGFAYADRGVYRPGETVHLTTLVRTHDGSASPVPVTLIFQRPDGVEHSRQALPDQGLGGRAARFGLAPSAMTGTWRIRVHTDPAAAPIAQAAFLVEDFVPERLELKVETPTEALSTQRAGVIKVAGRYLYGPPAAGLSVEGEVSVRSSQKDLPAFPGYKFGLADEQFSPVRKPLEQLPATGADGKADVAVDLPGFAKTSLPLEAHVIVRLRESGGRTIERTVTLPVDTGSARIGIKPLFKGEVGDSETAQFEAVLVGADGKAAPAKDLKWHLMRLERRWQWYSRDGSWTYDTVTSTRRVAAGTVDAAPGAPARIEARLDWGRYRLDVSDGTGLASSVQFNAGYWADESADTPEALDVALDKPAYQPGDTARVKITSRMAGRALVAVMGSGLLSTQEVDLPLGGGEVPITVGESWGPGAYVAVMLYRPLDEKAKRMPSRAVGLRWLAIDQKPRTLGVSLDVPVKVGSGSLLTVPVRIAGLAPDEEARVTIAATDVGILNLTRFETPRPDAWFYGQRRLGSEIRDLYGRLIDGMRAERGRLRSGGDGGEMAVQGSPPVEATLALFSGIVRVDPDGTAKVEFQLPDFNGSVRLTAVAWSATKVGSASKDTIVRDPVALTVSAPRFLTLGDEARLELALHNVEGQGATYKVTMQERQEQAKTYEMTVEGRPVSGVAPGLLVLPVAERDVAIAAGERKREVFAFKPDSVGLTKLALRITGPGGIDVRRSLSFDVKVPAGDIKRMSVATLAPNAGKITLSSDLLHDLIPSRTKVTVSVGPYGALDVAGILNALHRYPYGCAEQTVSRALPLLYVNSVAKRIGIAGDAELRERIDGAIARVLEKQDSSGAFGIWGPADGDMWLTSFVTDFLSRAKEQGHAVRQQAFAQALDRLANYIGYAQDFSHGGEDRAYALYVLARNGRAPIGELRYYVDTKLDSFATPLAQAQLGAALAMMGDRPRAERAFQAALGKLGDPDAGLTRRDYGSGIRDRAALITLAAESSLARPELPRLVEVVAKSYASQVYTSTQEQAWMLLAAHALAQEAKDMTLAVNAQPHQGELVRAVAPQELQTGPLVIANTGSAPVGAVVSVIGTAMTAEPPISKGFSIERTYYALDGKKVDLASAAGGLGKLKQNERLVVVLKVDATDTGGRILLVDRLPAGLEIENPRIVDSGEIKGLSWLKTTVAPQHTEFRDDRFVAAFDFFGGSAGWGRRARDADSAEPASGATVAYIVRAVTPGSFVHPAATVEDMYRPSRFARTAAGRLEVVAP
jgi:alpha-2-macroglobulin